MPAFPLAERLAGWSTTRSEGARGLLTLHVSMLDQPRSQRLVGNVLRRHASRVYCLGQRIVDLSQNPNCERRPVRTSRPPNSAPRLLAATGLLASFSGCRCASLTANDAASCPAG